MAASDGAFVRQVKPQSVVEQVTAEIRRSIVSGELSPGQEFSLRETAAHLGVSTAPVREALRVLQGEGLIIARRARSAVVAPMDLEDLRAIYQLRRLIEPAIAGRSCTLLTAADLAALERMAGAFGDEHASIDAIYETHRQFHLSLLGPAATAWDLRVLETLWNAAERYVRIGFGRLDPIPAEHSRRGLAHHDLVDAFRSRDSGTAQRAVLRHLDDNERIARKAIVDAT
ncbi:GntR family transcriptional regulator [Pseudonocardia sp. H11422]|uniref:GntR family transcriptional regulator n=1 Tax=Pseudonocardia sp. H11422 TaxID=2835866 RepID=UPI001BDD73C7|nr:GntR family transcriptional regulator [Pseudonocardia sp. H11422]